ncbi:MAG: hypothetical protein AB1798_05385, partial [Spirochaetota bacterium]
MFKNIKIGTKLIIVSILLSLAPLVVVGLVSYRNGASALMHEILDSLEESASAAMDKIDRNLFERYGDVQAITSVPTVFMAMQGEEDDLEALPKYVDTVTIIYGIYDLMIAAGKDGRIKAVNTVDSTGKPINSGHLIGKDVSRERWFQQVIEGTIKSGESYVEDYHVNDFVKSVYGADRYTIIFAAPIKNNNGEIIGGWANFAKREIIQEI